MAWELQLANFYPAKATVVGRSGVPRQKWDSFALQWKINDDQEIERTRSFLSTYCYADNPATADAAGTLPAARSSVTDPVVGPQRVTITGTFRLTAIEWDKDRKYWLLKFAKGWATEIAWAEAFIRGGADTSAGVRAFTVEWRNIADTAVKSCMDAIRAWTSPLTDPVIQGTTHSGTWAVGAITPTQAQDGSYVIAVQLNKVAEITAIADLQALTPVSRVYTEDVKNPFGAEGGYTDHVPKASSYAIVYSYAGISPSDATTAKLRTFTGANWNSLLLSTDRSKYEFASYRIDRTTDGIQLRVAYAYIPLKDSVVEADWRYGSKGVYNQSGVWKMEVTCARVNPAKIKDIMASAIMTQETVTDPVIEGVEHAGTWIINKTDAPITDGEGVRITQHRTKAGDQYLHTTHYSDIDHKVDTFKMVDAKAADVTAFVAETGTWAPATYNWGSAPAAGVDRKLDWGFNQDGTAWLTAIIVTVTSASVSMSPVESSTISRSIELAYNLTAAQLAARVASYSAAASVNVKRSIAPSARKSDGTYDFSGEIITFAEQVISRVRADDSEKTITETVGKYIIPGGANETANFTVPAQTVGTDVILTEPVPTDVGSYHISKLVTVWKNPTAQKVTESLLEKVTEDAAEAATAPIAAGPGEVRAGVEVETENTLRPHGKYKTRKRKTEERDIVTNSRIESAAESTAIEAHSAKPEDEVPGDRAVGEVITVDNEIKRSGARKTRRVVKTEKNQTGTKYRVTPLGVEAVTINTSAAAALAQPAATTGVESKVDNDPTPGGRVRTVLTTFTPAAWAGSVVPVEYNSIWAKYVRPFRNYPLTMNPGGGLPDLSSLSIGQYIEGLQPTDIGLYNGALVYYTLSDPLAGNSTLSNVYYSARVSEPEVRPREVERKLPRYDMTVGTGPTTYTYEGDNIWAWVWYFARLVTRYTSRQYSLRLVTIDSAGGTGTSENYGVTTNWMKRVVDVIPGRIWCVETHYAATGAWEYKGKTRTWLDFIEANKTGS